MEVGGYFGRVGAGAPLGEGWDLSSSLVGCLIHGQLGYVREGGWQGGTYDVDQTDSFDAYAFVPRYCEAMGHACAAVMAG